MLYTCPRLLHRLYHLLNECDFFICQMIFGIELLVYFGNSSIPINITISRKVLERDKCIHFACCMLRILF